MIEFHVTYSNQTDAGNAVKDAIGKRLAACGNIIPEIRSLYRWNGQIEDEREVLVVFKTSEAKAEALASYIADNHPYETPAIIRHSAVSANADYERWVETETNS